MTIIFMITKAVMLIGFTVAAFLGLATALGVNLLPDSAAATCGAIAPQLCLFPIM